MQNQQINDLIETLLNAVSEQERSQAARQLSTLATQIESPSDFEPYILNISKALNDSSQDVQFHAVHSLVTLAERAVNIQAALPELAQCLEAPFAVNVQKEAVWGVVCIAYSGGDISEAMPMLDNNITNGTAIKGNGSIALTLHYLHNAAADEAERLLETNDGHIRFGVAYAATTFAVTDNDITALEKVLAKIQYGLPDRDLITGVAGAITWLQDMERDTSVVIDTIRKAAAAADIVRQAALNGIFFHLRKR